MERLHCLSKDRVMCKYITLCPASRLLCCITCYLCYITLPTYCITLVYYCIIPRVCWVIHLYSCITLPSYYNIPCTYCIIIICSEANSSYEEEQKVVAIRKVYHLACSQPLIDVEPIWRDYTDFEEVNT